MQVKLTLGAISPQELLNLLNSKDHADEFGNDQCREGEPVFSKEDLENLLDRSDLVRDSSDKENLKKGGKKAAGKIKKQGSKVFKVVDSEVSSMGSFGGTIL